MSFINGYFNVGLAWIEQRENIQWIRRDQIMLLKFRCIIDKYAKKLRDFIVNKC